MNVLQLQETMITTYRGHTSTINAVAWAPNESYATKLYRSRIASASDDGTVQIWDAMSGRRSANAYRGHSGGVRALAWSPDRKRMASAGIDRTVQLWEVSTNPKADINRGDCMHIPDV